MADFFNYTNPDPEKLVILLKCLALSKVEIYINSIYIRNLY